jgi:2,5-dioxopentanoate dehydrogenase
LRKIMMPLGPVVVFGAANFPLAYSTAGGDTASALAAGCPVIVKGHPAHPDTSALVAEAITKAAQKTSMPAGVFQHVPGRIEIGQALVSHPLTRAVGFTGSLAGGKALFDLANQRPYPIPVFAEMSSINPVILLPKTLNETAKPTAEALVKSLTTGLGQFCTCPGLWIAQVGEGLRQFEGFAANILTKVEAGKMLHQGIADNYHTRVEECLNQYGVELIFGDAGSGKGLEALPVVAKVNAVDFLTQPTLQEEVFGPFALVVEVEDRHQFTEVVSKLQGQLTCSIWGTEEEMQAHSGLLNLLLEKAGRIVANGVPTGVEVAGPMQHGGPYPATTDSRFTAVGPDAIKRFLRPVAFQNFPEGLLPERLRGW